MDGPTLTTGLCNCPPPQGVVCFQKPPRWCVQSVGNRTILGAANHHPPPVFKIRQVATNPNKPRQTPSDLDRSRLVPTDPYKSRQISTDPKKNPAKTAKIQSVWRCLPPTRLFPLGLGRLGTHGRSQTLWGFFVLFLLADLVADQILCHDPPPPPSVASSAGVLKSATR